MTFNVGSALLTAINPAFGGSLPPGYHATTLSPAAYVQYHARDSNPTVDGNGRVTLLTDLMGLANASEGTGASSLGGPTLRTDQRGRPYLDFDRSCYMVGATGFSAVATRAFVFYMVMRCPNVQTGTMAMFSLGRADLGTALNTNGTLCSQITASNAVPFLRTTNITATSATSSVTYMIPGCQLQLVMWVSRAAANGGLNFVHNQVKAPVSTATLAFNATSSAGSGFEWMRYAQSPGTVGQWGEGFVYESGFYKGEMSDADVTAWASQICANYARPPVVNRLFLEGNSIEHGWNGVNTPPVLPYQSPGIVATDEGRSGILPADWSVINIASNGAELAALTSIIYSRKNATNGWVNWPLAGGDNILAMQAGVNDWGNATLNTAADVYAADVAYWNSAIPGNEGVLQRNAAWKGARMENIALGNVTSQGKTATLRGLLAAPQYLTDTLTNTGQTYDGRLKPYALYTAQSSAIFDTSLQAANNTNYQTDALHPTPVGTVIMMLDPSVGFVASVLALAA